MNKIIKMVITPEKEWWQFWIPNKIEYKENEDFFVHKTCITFYKAPPKGQIECIYDTN